MPLLDSLAKLGDLPDRKTFLSECVASVESVVDPRGYRPSIKSGQRPSLMRSILRLVARSTPDELNKHGANLARALAIEETARAVVSFASILLRPSEAAQAAAAIGREVLIDSYAAYQVLNGAAHAADYPRFSIALLVAFSIDLRSTLGDLRTLIEELPTR
jgi:hypothetical protein